MPNKSKSKSRRSNKSKRSNKKIGGNGTVNKNNLPEILTKHDIRRFNGKEYDINTAEGLQAFHDAHDADLGINRNKNQNINQNIKKENTKEEPPKKKYSILTLAAGLFCIGIVIGVPLLIKKN